MKHTKKEIILSIMVMFLASAFIALVLSILLVLLQKAAPHLFDNWSMLEPSRICQVALRLVDCELKGTTPQ